MARPGYIELGSARKAVRMPILFEDRSVIAIDKSAGWMLVPFSWQTTQRNLQAAITSAIAAGTFWARSRNLRYLHHVHRLDADTTGILLLARSPGSLKAYAALFESRRMEKVYLAVAQGRPSRHEWTCKVGISPASGQPGRMLLDPKHGKQAETHFKTLQSTTGRTLIEARPRTGRTHQIRLHLLEAGLSVIGDPLYGTTSPYAQPLENSPFPMGLRAVELRYVDPFRRTPVHIVAPTADFLAQYGFSPLPSVGATVP